MPAEPPARPDPFLVAFGPAAHERLEALEAGLMADGVDPWDRDAWTLSRAGAAFLRELHPEGGLGEGVAELVALAHAGYLYWRLGRVTVEVSREDLEQLRGPAPPGADRGPSLEAYYVRLPQHRIWGAAIAGSAPEPLDGWFAVVRNGTLSVVGVFGLLAGRPGFTVAIASGPQPGPLARADGSPPFAPTVPGGAAAGLWSLVGHEELLALGWQAHRVVPRPSGQPATARSAS